jgi:serine/threonine-protein kinase
MFKLLTGKEPFTGGEATASFKIMNERHTGLSAYLHDYPKVLDEIVEKSLAKNPEDRYQSGEDFSDALHEIIEDLKRTRVAELFNDAERLTTERRFAPALELLDEAVKLDSVEYPGAQAAQVCPRAPGARAARPASARVPAQE